MTYPLEKAAALAEARIRLTMRILEDAESRQTLPCIPGLRYTPTVQTSLCPPALPLVQTVSLAFRNPAAASSPIPMTQLLSGYWARISSIPHRSQMQILERLAPAPRALSADQDWPPLT